MSLSRSDKINVKVTDLETNITTTYNSMSAAASALNIPKSRISMYFANNQQKPYKNRYIFKKVLDI
jgi:hypothetical protein